MYLYIAENDLMKGFCKIGYSSNLEQRMGELYGEWRVVKSFETGFNSQSYETKIKRIMKDFVASGYELFNCPTDILIKVATEVVEGSNSNLSLLDCILEPPTGVISIEPDICKLGKLVKKVRNDQDLTQIQLAGVCNVSPKFIIDLEKGKSTCEISKVHHVIRMLGIKLHYTYTPIKD